jgi:hypothetical protein
MVMALSAELLTAGDPGTLAIGDAAATLRVRNDGTDEIGVTAGPAVPERQLHAGGPTTLYVYVADIANGIRVLNVKPPDGWAATHLGSAWALTPTGAPALAAAGELAFDLTLTAVTSPPRDATVTLAVHNAGTLPEASLPVPVKVVEPRAGVPLVLDFGVDGSNRISLANLPNSRRLRIANPGAQPIVPGATSRSGARFQLSFVVDDPPGRGALTTREQAKALEIGVAETYEDLWSVERVLGDGDPYWVLTPEAPEILGVGEAATVELELHNIRSSLEPGSTRVYLAWTGVPGHPSGATSCDLLKVPGTPTATLRATPDPPIVEHGTPFTLTWDTVLVSSLVLSYVAGGRQHRLVAPTDIPFSGNMTPQPLPDVGSTTYYLSAKRQDGSSLPTRDVTVTVVEPPPTIGSLTADPNPVFAEGTPVVLSWEFANADTLSLVPFRDAVHDGPATWPFTGTQEFVLTAVGAGGQTAEKRVTVYSLADFLVAFPWVLQAQGPGEGGERIELTETLSLRGDGSCIYTNTIARIAETESISMRYAPRSHWSLQRNIVTVQIDDGGFVVLRLLGDSLESASPVTFEGVDRRGALFKPQRPAG